MARALELHRLTLGSLVVKPLQVRIDDQVRPSDNAPARLCLPGGRGQWRVEDLRSGENLRSRLEYGLLGRQIGCEVLWEVGLVEESEAVGGRFDRSGLRLRG